MKILRFAAMIAAAAYCLPAFAHITLEKPEAAPHSGYKAVFRLPHGCEGSATISVKITLPEGVIAAKPMPKAGWKLDISKGNYAASYKYYGETLTSGARDITWSGGSLPDDQYDEFVINTYLADTLTAGSTLYFPVIQTCEKGSIAWVQIPKDGQSAHDAGEPAPGLKIIAAAASDGSKVYTLGDLVISNPWLRATPNGAKVGGGFVKIINNDHHADKLKAVSFDIAGAAQIHEMKMEGDVMRMAELPDGIDIPAHGSLVLEPGKLHLMLLDLKQPLKDGDHIKGSLTFEKAGRVEVEFIVRPMGAGAGSMDHMH